MSATIVEGENQRHLSEERRARPAEMMLRLGVGCALATGAVSVTVLVGYAVGNRLLTSFVSGGANTRPNAAAGFLLLATGLLLTVLSSRWRWTGKLFGAIAMLLGMGVMAEDAFGWQLGIDNVLFTAQASAWQPVSAGRISVPAALTLLSLGMALLLIDWEPRRHFRPAQALAVAALLITLASLQGLTFHVPELASFGRAIWIGLPAALAGTLFSLGVLLVRPDRGFMVVFSSERAGGMMLRWSLPVAIAGVWLIGWASATGLHRGWYGSDVHQVMFGLPLMVLFTVLLLRVAVMLNRGAERQEEQQAQLESFNRDLEARVEQRTARLRETSNALETEVAQRRSREAELRRASLYARSLIEASLDPLVTISREGKITDVNAATEKVTGKTRAQLIGTDFCDYFAEPEAARNGYQRVFAEGSVYDYPLAIRGGGKVTDVLYNASVFRNEAGEVEGVFAAARDVTARKQAEEALRKASRYARSLIEASLDPLVTISREGKITDVNAATEKVTGKTRAQLIGTDFCDYFTEPEEARRGYQRVFAEGSVYDYPLAIRGGGKVTDVLYNASVFRNEAGEVEGVFAAARDVTARVRAEGEIRALNAELEARVADRTAALAAANKELEAFTYSVAHDLRTPLRHVHGFVTLLAEDYQARFDETGRTYLQHVLKGSEQMGHLIDDLLNLSRVNRQHLVPQTVGLGRVVQDARERLQGEAAGRVVEWRIGEMPFVECDAGLVGQVFYNLLANALKFTRPRSPAIIEVGLRREGSEEVFFVRDNGVGFNMKYADKLFGVFQRLHRAEDFEGTGVGLVTVQRIVHKHGGRIWAEAQLDRGATFYFTLGAPEAAPAPELAAVGEEHATTCG